MFLAFLLNRKTEGRRQKAEGGGHWAGRQATQQHHTSFAIGHRSSDIGHWSFKLASSCEPMATHDERSWPPVFRLLPPAFCLLLPAFRLLLSAFCFLPSAFRLLLSASCLLPSGSCLLLSLLRLQRKDAVPVRGRGDLQKMLAALHVSPSHGVIGKALEMSQDQRAGTIPIPLP